MINAHIIYIYILTKRCGFYTFFYSKNTPGTDTHHLFFSRKSLVAIWIGFHIDTSDQSLTKDLESGGFSPTSAVPTIPGEVWQVESWRELQNGSKGRGFGAEIRERSTWMFREVRING